jgi:hypothetical protein
MSDKIGEAAAGLTLTMDAQRAANAQANEKRMEQARAKARAAPLSGDEIAAWIAHGRAQGIADERARCVVCALNFVADVPGDLGVAVAREIVRLIEAG